MATRPRPSRLRILYKGHHPGKTVPPWALEADTGRTLFATMDPRIASQHRPAVLRLELSGDAKVLFDDGRKQFAALLAEGRRGRYDAVWFADQNVGVAILNRGKIVTKVWIEVA